MQDTLLIPEYKAEDILRADSAYLAEESEKRLSDEIKRAANRIFSAKEVKIVLLSGPSASGKTSVAKLICDGVNSLGRKAECISLDDFFLGISALPLLPDGNYDMESILGLDTALANECFARLLECGEAEIPTFDFPNQRRGERVNPVRIGRDGVILVEGIHALNPLLTENLPTEDIIRIYVAPQRSYSLDGKILINPTEIRFVRRIIRDELFRSWNAEKTFVQWQSVLDGEKIYINPYRDTAEISLDSSLCYEPAVISRTAAEFIGRIPETSPYYASARALSEKFMLFGAISEKLIPEGSILHEFLG